MFAINQFKRCSKISKCRHRKVVAHLASMSDGPPPKGDGHTLLSNVAPPHLLDNPPVRLDETILRLAIEWGSLKKDTMVLKEG